MILIIEDDEPTARALGRLFSRHGVEVVGTLADARDKLSWKPYHRLVITDWCFPVDPSGPVIEGAGARVAAYAAQAGVPCVVYSGSERPADFGGVWVTKGGIDELRAAVQAALEGGA